MKHAIIIFLLIFSINLNAQNDYRIDHSIWVGTSVISDATSNVFFQYEPRSEWVQLQIIYLTDFKGKDQRLNLKGGIRPMYLRKPQLGFWVYLPYLNMNIREGFAYNTPFSMEFRWKQQLSLIMDATGGDVQFQVRYRTKIFSKKSKK